MNFLRDKGWKIINFRELDYLSSIIVVNPELFPGSAVKIDFSMDLVGMVFNQKALI